MSAAVETATPTARDLERALLHRYMVEQNGWAALREVTVADRDACRRFRRARDLTSRQMRLNTRYRGHGEAVPPWPMWMRRALDANYFRATLQRRIDLLLIRTSGSQKVPYERIAVEIKVARSDFLRDDATKRRAWETVAHRFAYATPPDLVAPDEVPAHCGLLHVDVDAGPFGRVRWAKHAPRLEHEPEPFGDRWVAYLAGRAARAEWYGGTP